MGGTERSALCGEGQALSPRGDINHGPVHGEIPEKSGSGTRLIGGGAEHQAESGRAPNGVTLSPSGTGPEVRGPGGAGIRVPGWFTLFAGGKAAISLEVRGDCA